MFYASDDQPILQLAGERVVVGEASITEFRPREGPIVAHV